MVLRSILVLAILVAFMLPSGARAQASCSDETDAVVRTQCEEAAKAKLERDKALVDHVPGQITAPPAITALPTPTPPPYTPPPVPPVPPVDLEALVRQACGLRLRPTSGAPGERETIVVSTQRRTPIEQAIQSGAAPSAQLEAMNLDACFSLLGNEYVLVAPPDKKDGIFQVIGGDASAFSRWLSGSEAVDGRLRLAPESDCAALLDQIRNLSNTAAVWVEQDHGPSRCERDSNGSARLDPNKVDGYGGVIVLKLQRS